MYRIHNGVGLPKDKIDILIVNNMTKDDSFSIFCQCQKDFPELHMNWLNAKQGKSRALNLALFNSNGKYIIHIDSDGVLETSAIRNMVTMFENEDDVDCLTGTILTNPTQIDETRGFSSVSCRNWSLVSIVRRFLQAEIFSQS